MWVCRSDVVSSSIVPRLLLPTVILLCLHSEDGLLAWVVSLRGL